ncbi:hypothetical protein C1645_794926 [Glomus cerebriforme]|uniref:Uncharacterized protein n=1 Tax=Glomus cerebriforme TaxID=658196 RepID=A0A397RY19_9GLOM|nr:hypothetical protein C1645_794926 [Glomus cerebriforme]
MPISLDLICKFVSTSCGICFLFFLSLSHVKTWRKENLSLACRYVKLSIVEKNSLFLLSIQLILYNLFVLKHFTKSSSA